jgi:hypothetical protein
MKDKSIELKLNIAADVAADDEERADLARHTRDELRELRSVEKIEALLADETPERSKSGLAPQDWQSLLLTLAASGGVLTTLINALQSIVTSRAGHTITLEINGDKVSITGSLSRKDRALISEWLSRHDK